MLRPQIVICVIPAPVAAGEDGIPGAHGAPQLALDGELSGHKDGAEFCRYEGVSGGTSK